MAGKTIKNKCCLAININGNFIFADPKSSRWDMREGVRIDKEEFLLIDTTFIPDEISYELDKAYKTVIRRLKLRS